MKMITALRNTFIEHLYSNMSQNMFDTKKDVRIQPGLVWGCVQQDKPGSSKGTFMMNILIHQLLPMYNCVNIIKIKYCVERYMHRK